MNIDSLSGRRSEVAIELFLEGKSFSYKGILFHKDNSNLYINSYSEFSFINTTKEMGIEKIRYSKEILEEIVNSIPLFKKEINGLNKKYAFYCDDYKAGILIAKEQDNIIEWNI